MNAVTIALNLALAPNFALQGGDHVLFYGDSITEQQLYTSYVEAFVVTRYPHLDIKFTTSGWGGDATWGGGGGTIEQRTARDVKPYAPTQITIMLGMNDAGYVVPTDQRILSIFKEWYPKLLTQMSLAAPKAKITLIGSSPFDDVTRKDPRFSGYNNSVRDFIQAVRELANAKSLSFVDFNSPVVEVLQKVNSRDNTLASQLIPDHIHPGPAAHLVMAQALLEHWNASPVVSSVHLDASKNAIVSSEHAKVTSFNGNTWTQLDESLPYPINADDPTFTLALEASNFNQQLNQQVIRVDGLESGSYKLLIDGSVIGTYSAANLAAGVNLGGRDTPMNKHAMAVLDLIQKRNRAHFLRTREFEFNFGTLKSSKEASSAIQAVEAELNKHLRDLAKPKPHTFALEPSPK